MTVKSGFPYHCAFVACRGNCGDSPNCKYGCMGCGKCADECEFGAISIKDNQTAVVDEEKCTACGKCVKVCQNKLIIIREKVSFIAVKCSNKDKGKAAKESCMASCIGCGICEKTCTARAIKVKDNCAIIDEKKCLGCGMCAVKCPRGAISDLRGILTEK